MLWVAGVLAFIAGLPQLGVAVFAVVLVNALFSFLQESRADRAAERLRALLPTRVNVRRDGRPQTIDADDVVVGDCLLLEAGDRVPADGVTHASVALLVDTSLLTGESRPADVPAGGPIFAGTFVVEGTGEASVTAIGRDTRLAGIALLTTSGEKPVTPLSRSLNDVVRLVAVIAVGLGALFFGISLLLGSDPQDGFVFAIGVTVAMVPEALLPTVTLSLAWGAEQMAKRNVLVRNLPAVETLGSTTLICTDKTGTLTMNQMSVVRAWTPTGTVTVQGTGYEPLADVVVVGDRSSLEALALAGARCATGYAYEKDGRWQAHGDPMEAAVDAFSRRLGGDPDADRAQRPGSARFPFDPRRRRMSIVIDGEVVVKGAPDTVLPLCAASDGADAVVEEMTRTGLRVLAVARRAVSDGPITSAGAAEQHLVLDGLLALEDPPRAGVRDAVAACRRAGVHILMITGDHPKTAEAIADEVGLRSSEGLVVSGADLPADDAELGELLDHDGTVVARVSPEDKLRIARVLRARGHVVAMTGDGVNDAPALKKADIGVAMGITGTDVTKEAAAMTLTDDNFASIVAAVEEGRGISGNIKKYLMYLLSSNIGEIGLMAGASLAGLPLPLSAVQILYVNLATDGLPALALAVDPPEPDLMRRGPRNPRAGIFTRPVVSLMLAGGIWSTIINAGIFAWALKSGRTQDEAMTMVFVQLVLTEFFKAYNFRSDRHSALIRPFANKWLNAAIVWELILLTLIVYVPFLHAPFGTYSLPWFDWAIVITLAATVAPVLEAAKWLERRGWFGEVT